MFNLVYYFTKIGILKIARYIYDQYNNPCEIKLIVERYQQSNFVEDRGAVKYSRSGRSNENQVRESGVAEPKKFIS